VLTTFLFITKSLGRLQLVLVLGEIPRGGLIVCSLPPDTLFRMIPFSLGASVMSAVAGIAVTRSGAYRGIIWAGWAVMILGWGLMITLDDHSNT
jgi:hypothetical protein